MGERIMASPTAVQIDSRTLAKPRVLIVDDEIDILGIISETVGKGLGFRLLQAKNLGEARHILENQSVELLVTDVHLPDGDGTTLLPMLRREQPHAQAIVISGSPSVDGAITALRHGAVDFLTKPFTAKDLSERVGRALKRQAVRSEEHTSELQSQSNLVCRLLLEKKKQ